MHPSTAFTPYIASLPNGIRIIHRLCEGAVGCCGFVVHAGSRHEEASELGLAHFMEHLLFKGTSKRRPHHIVNRMDAVGGELNAYTTKEETFVYSVFLHKDFSRAVELLSDLFFHSTFPQEEIEKEREVILDEIRSYEDSPSELIFDDYEDLLLAGHPIGRKILGDPACLETFVSRSFVDFYRRNYTTDRIVFFSQSSLSFSKVKQCVEKFVGTTPFSSRWVPFTGESMCVRHGERKTLLKGTHQAHVVWGNACYSLFEDKRVGMHLINNLLGGPGMNSRLNVALRERKGLVYSVESNVSLYTDVGVFTIYFGTDIRQVERCLELVEKELRRLRENKLTTSQLHAAKKQLYGQMMISSENKESQTLGMGKSMLHYNRYDSLQEVVRKVDMLTPEQLLEIANEVLNVQQMSWLVYK